MYLQNWNHRQGNNQKQQKNICVPLTQILINWVRINWNRCLYTRLFIHPKFVCNGFILMKFHLTFHRCHHYTYIKGIEDSTISIWHALWISTFWKWFDKRKGKKKERDEDRLKPWRFWKCIISISLLLTVSNLLCYLMKSSFTRKSWNWWIFGANIYELQHNFSATISFEVRYTLLYIIYWTPVVKFITLCILFIIVNNATLFAFHQIFIEQNSKTNYAYQEPKSKTTLKNKLNNFETIFIKVKPIVNYAEAINKNAMHIGIS